MVGGKKVTVKNLYEWDLEVVVVTKWKMYIYMI